MPPALGHHFVGMSMIDSLRHFLPLAQIPHWPRPGLNNAWISMALVSPLTLHRRQRRFR